MRMLSSNFMHNLQYGFLADLTQQIVEDQDLDLQIRDGYFNIYYKGNSLLKLAERANSRYEVGIDPTFTQGVPVPSQLVDPQSTIEFIHQIPWLEHNITRYGKTSLEIEYEQLIIRANNSELRNNSDYFIIDRQYASGEARFDLTGIYWDRAQRRSGQTVPLCLMEVKFALNPDIKEIDRQLARCYNIIKENTATLAAETEGILKQKLKLGLYNQSPERVEAMKTLNISDDIELVQFVIILIDYNPHSTLFKND